MVEATYQEEEEEEDITIRNLDLDSSPTLHTDPHHKIHTMRSQAICLRTINHRHTMELEGRNHLQILEENHWRQLVMVTSMMLTMMVNLMAVMMTTKSNTISLVHQEELLH